MFLALCTGTHFRYGTIWWQPISRDIIPGNPGSYPVGFSLSLAYRRDYRWGSLFHEQWSNGNDTWIGERKKSSTYFTFPDDGNDGRDYEGTYQIKFPVGNELVSTRVRSSLLELPHFT